MSRRLAFLSTLALLAPLLAGCVVDPGKPREIQLTLKIATLMPMSGALSDLGPGMQNGARLAMKLVNDANVGLKIEAMHEDGTTSDRGAVTSAFNRVTAGNGATAIVGPCCEELASTVAALAKAKRVVVVAPTADATPASDLLWRVVPTDGGQGRALAALVTRAGHADASLIVANDPYGRGLESAFRAAFTGRVAVAAHYDEATAGDMSGEASRVCAPPIAGAVVVLGQAAEAAALLRAMHAQECLAKVAVFASDHARAPALVTAADRDLAGRWLAAGVQGTSAGTPGGFSSIYRAEFNAEPTPYAAASFDAVMQIALAAVAANSVEGKAMSDAMAKILNAPGAKYRGDQFKAAATSLLSGDDVDYQGFAHDFTWNVAAREPQSGAFDVWKVSPEGTFETADRAVSG